MYKNFFWKKKFVGEAHFGKNYAAESDVFMSTRLLFSIGYNRYEVESRPHHVFNPEYLSCVSPLASVPEMCRQLYLYWIRLVKPFYELQNSLC